MQINWNLELRVPKERMKPKIWSRGFGGTFAAGFGGLAYH
jgi:hypothetical protein